jgi:hypothetical protein
MELLDLVGSFFFLVVLSEITIECVIAITNKVLAHL